MAWGDIQTKHEMVFGLVDREGKLVVESATMECLKWWKELFERRDYQPVRLTTVQLEYEVIEIPGSIKAVSPFEPNEKEPKKEEKPKKEPKQSQGQVNVDELYAKFFGSK